MIDYKTMLQIINDSADPAAELQAFVEQERKAGPPIEEAAIQAEWARRYPNWPALDMALEAETSVINWQTGEIEEMSLEDQRLAWDASPDDGPWSLDDYAAHTCSAIEYDLKNGVFPDPMTRESMET